MDGIYAKTITLKVTYKGFKKITRSKTDDGTNKADEIYAVAASLLDAIDKKPIRLIGISLSGFTDTIVKQVSLFDNCASEKAEKKDSIILDLQRRYGINALKSGSELNAEKRVKSD